LCLMMRRVPCSYRFAYTTLFRSKAGVMRGGLAGVGVVTVLAFIIAIGLWLTAPMVVSAYTTDPAILAIAAPALVLATLFFVADRSEEHTSELHSRENLVCRLLLE